VEDDASIRRMLAHVCDIVGVEYDEADTVQLALDKIDDGCPDLVLLDMLMDGRLASDIFEHCRRQNKVPRIVMMTALSCADKLAKRFKPDHLVKKPFDLDTLMNLLN